MKRFLFLLSSSLLLTGLAHAQVGVRVGANLLRFNTNSVDGDGARTATSGKLGYQVGAYYQQPLTKHLSLVPEVQYSREQTQVNFEAYRNAENYTRGSYDVRLNYVHVPVLLRYTMGRVHFEAGPQASLLVGGRGTGQSNTLIGGDGRVDRAIDQAATDRFRRFSLGASVGVGVALPAGLGLDVRAYQGITYMNQSIDPERSGAIPYWGGNLRRQTLQASLTYQLASR